MSPQCTIECGLSGYKRDAYLKHLCDYIRSSMIFIPYFSIASSVLQMHSFTRSTTIIDRIFSIRFIHPDCTQSFLIFLKAVALCFLFLLLCFFFIYISHFLIFFEGIFVVNIISRHTVNIGMDAQLSIDLLNIHKYTHFSNESHRLC